MYNPAKNKKQNLLFKFIKMDVNMKVQLLMDINKEKENYFILMEHITKDNFQKIKCMDMVHFTMELTDLHIKDFGTKINFMEKAFYIMKTYK